MKAKFQTRLSDRDTRTNLAEVSPLATPYVLIVDPSSKCNFKCRFCPTGHPRLIKETGRYQGSMSLSNFEKIINDLSDFPDPIKVLRLYKEGEPLLNKNIGKFIAYARESSKVLSVDTTTNGVLLTPRMSEQLISAGINQINISVNGIRDEHFSDLVHTKVNFSRYLENIKYLFSIKGDCIIYIKAIHENLSEVEREIFLDLFGNYSDRIFFEHLFPNWPGFDDKSIPRDGNISLYGGPVKERLICPYIFYSITVNSDATVSLCIQDWQRKLIVGDLKTQSLRDIWMGASMKMHRILHLQGNRKENPICGNCGVMKFSTYDDIDHGANQILKRLSNNDYVMPTAK